MRGKHGMGQAMRQSREVELTELEIQVLMFERQWWCYEGSKDKAIRELFGITPTRYYQMLSSLIDTAKAMVFDPRLVARLRRQRDERYKARSARRLTAPSLPSPTGQSR
ncbi:MAG: DUF3263 domain-containing protein [Bifidobacteriaceae bacterium]|jgi:hypothetical protein|nr:DUF3263 domain-containing protein [Bifidobacteriaceae bacterium]